MTPYRIEPTDTIPNYVFNSWLRARWEARAWSGPSDPSSPTKCQWMAVEHDRIDALARRPGWLLLLLLNPDAPHWIGGYCAAERLRDRVAIHWLCVKREWRRHGQGTALLRAAQAHCGGHPLIAATYHPKWSPRAKKRGIETDTRLGRTT